MGRGPSSFDPAIASIIVATIAAVASVLTAYLAHRLSRSAAESERQLTRRGVRARPTIRDRVEAIDSRVERIETKQDAHGARLEDHLDTSHAFIHANVADRGRLWRAIDEIRRHLHLRPARSDPTRGGDTL